jgi:hypothetical protein
MLREQNGVNPVLRGGVVLEHGRDRRIGFDDLVDDDVVRLGVLRQEFLDLLDGDNSLTSVTHALNLDVGVAACGHRAISPGRDWSQLVDAADFLLRHPAEAGLVKDALHGRNGLFPNGREPRKAADWLPFLETTFPVSDGLLSRIAPAGILRSVGKGLAALPDSTAAILRRLDSGEHVPGYTALYFEAVAPIQQSVAFLTGGWFEIVVAKAMQHSGRFRDIRWSAQIEQQGGAQIEEDLLALDGLEAVCVSCKSSSERARILPHLEEFQSRAHSIGGRMTRRFLAIHTLRDPQGHVASRAKALGINLLTPGDLSKPAPFA